jgi:hypothetical protein
VDRAGLWASISRLFHEPHLGTHRELLERSTQHTVAMKIDQPAVLGLDAPEVLRTIQLAYVTVWQVDVRLHLLVPLALIVLDFAPGGPEGVAQRDIGIFVGMVGRMSLSDGDLRARHGEIDPDFEQLSLPVVLVRRLHDHVTAHDMVTVPLKPLRKLADTGLKSRRRIHMTKRHL